MGGSETGPSYEVPRVTRIKPYRAGGKQVYIVVIEDEHMSSPQAYRQAQLAKDQLGLIREVTVISTPTGFELHVDHSGTNEVAAFELLEFFFRPLYVGTTTASAHIVRRSGRIAHVNVCIAVTDKILKQYQAGIQLVNEIEAVSGINNCNIDGTRQQLTLQVTELADYDARQIALEVAKLTRHELVGEFIIRDIAFS